MSQPGAVGKIGPPALTVRIYKRHRNGAQVFLATFRSLPSLGDAIDRALMAYGKRLGAGWRLHVKPLKEVHSC